MNEDFLICTNGHEASWPAIEYGSWVAASLGGSVTLLGVAERLPAASMDAKYPLENVFARAVELFEQKGLQYKLDIQNGDAERVIPREAAKRQGIVVLGRLDRPALRRFFSGRSIRPLLAAITSPVLYVPRSCLPLKKMLVCLGGLGYEFNAEQLAIRLGQSSQAQVMLLHVAQVVDLDYPTARAEREHWRDLEKTDSLLGRNVRHALEAARAAGLSAEIKARQGNVVEEILAEVKSGGYDLVCMGSPYSGHGLRHMYGPNVTDEVAERVACPLFTARYSSIPAPKRPSG
jgi:nucleotide-binding universal stress UspA family protein